MNHTQTEPTPIQVGTAEAAKLLRMSERFLHQLKQDGSIPHIKVGTKIFYNVQSLNDWSKSQEQGGNDNE